MAMRKFVFRHKMEDFNNLLREDERFRKVATKYETDGESEVNGYVQTWTVELNPNDKEVAYMIDNLTFIECR